MHPDDVTGLKRLGIHRDGHLDRHELDRIVHTNLTDGTSTSDLQLMLSCLGKPVEGFDPQPSRRVILAELQRRGVTPGR
jgi:hypothetical protein